MVAEETINGGRNPGKLGMIALVAAGIMVLIGLASIFMFRHVVFPWDMWDTVPLYQHMRDGQGSWALFWSLHNEHRILFPRLFILLDYGLASASGNILLILILVLHAAHAWLLIGAFSRGESMPRRSMILYSSIVVMSFIWLKQRENFIWPFQIAWMLNAFFTSLAAYLAVTRPSGRGLVASGLCAVVGAFSLASGILMPFIIAAMLWRAGVSKGRLAGWLGFSTVLAVAYILGYAPVDNGLSSPSLLQFIGFVAAYLGNPFMMAGIPMVFALVLGCAGLLGYAWLGLRFLRGGPAQPYFRFAFAVATYAVAMVVLTSWGRASLGLSAAGANRYVTTTMVFWVTVLGLLASQVTPKVRDRMFRYALIGCLVFLVPTQILFVRKMHEKFRIYDEASLALIAGVQDSTALYALYPNSQTLWRAREVLRSDRLSIYRADWALAVGGGLSRGLMQSLTQSPFAATIEDARFVEHEQYAGYFIRGRFRDDGPRKSSKVLLLMHGDTVAGIAKTAYRDCGGCFSGYIAGRNRNFEVIEWSTDENAFKRITLR